MRRMTKIIVDEADHEQTVEILLSMNEHFASHYNISFALSRSIGFNSDSTSDTQLISDLSDYFDVELINRFSQKYTFSEISRSVYRKIVEKRLASEIKVIKRLHPELNMDSLFSADELAKAVDKITADTYNIKSGARPAITAVSKFIDSKLLSHFSRMAKTYRPNQN